MTTVHYSFIETTLVLFVWEVHIIHETVSPLQEVSVAQVGESIVSADSVITEWVNSSGEQISWYCYSSRLMMSLWCDRYR